jgi:tRNA A-37 threonylcarbamoyl transferase component Bud32
LRTASGRDLYRFKREFRALADVIHPNLAALHELVAASGDWYFTMELVDGVSFIDWVRPGKIAAGPARTRADIAATPLDEARLRGALAQLADALVALHHAGVLHRDLKPSNVLVAPNGRVVVLDFGLAARVADGEPEQLAVGTPVYMSPEQAADQPLGEPSDWYAVGAMLYEALVGRRPFEGDSEQVMTRKQREVPADPRAHGAAIPEDLARLALALLQPHPRQRPTGDAVLAQLGAQPSPRTRDITRPLPPAAFVGRTRELDELRRALGDARRRGVTVMVRGPAGIGKTALVRRFVRELGGAVFALEGRCFEREQVPFKMLDGIVDDLAAPRTGSPPDNADPLGAIAPAIARDLPALVRLFPVMKRVPRFAELAEQGAAPNEPAELVRRGFAALRALLARLALVRPVVVFVDDVHWGDADSAGFLAQLVHAGDPQLLVVLAHRPEDYLGIIARLRQPPGGSSRRGDVRELDVAALPDADALGLVAQLSGDAARAAAPPAEAIVRAARGNPLVLSEMARAKELPVGGMAELVRARAAALPAEARALLAVSSVAARPIAVEVAARAAGIDGGLVEAAQLAAERLASIRRVGDRMILAPAHDHVRAAVLAAQSNEERAEWHEALARAFEETSGDELAAVEHWLAAGHPDRAAEHAIGAARRAEDALAFRRAAELYEIALAYGAWDAHGQRDLLCAKARALACAGQLDEAASVLDHAARLVGDAAALDVERRRVEVLVRRARLGEVLPAVERLLAELGVRVAFGKVPRERRSAPHHRLRGEAPSADLRVDILHAVTSDLAFVDPALGRRALPHLMRAAHALGDRERLCLALAQDASFAACVGSRRARGDGAIAQRLDALARELGGAAVGIADAALGIAAFREGRFRDARERLEVGLAALREHAAADAHGSLRWAIDDAETYWLGTSLYLGEWSELVRLSPVLLRDAIERGDAALQLALATGRNVFAGLVAARPNDARDRLTAARAHLPAGFYLPHALVAQAEAWIDLYAGDAAGAAARLGAAWPAIERAGVLAIQQLRVELLLLRARLAIAAPARDRDPRRFADAAIAEGVPWAVGLGLATRASIHAAAGEQDDAVAALAAAEEQLAACEMAGWIDVVRLRRGAAEGGAASSARAHAARDGLVDRGAVDPDALAQLILPWPQ